MTEEEFNNWFRCEIEIIQAQLITLVESENFKDRTVSNNYMKMAVCKLENAINSCYLKDMSNE